MNNQELRELDAWIAEHVMKPSMPLSGFRPTICPADAMEVLKKCATESSGYQIQIDYDKSGWAVGRGGEGLHSTAETLELAIALFSKKLFSK